MSTVYLDESLQSLIKNIEKLKGRSEAMQGHLKNHDIELGEIISRETMDKIIGDDELARAFIGQMNGFYYEGTKLVNVLSGHLDEYRGRWVIEQAKKADQNRAELRHLRRLWIDKLWRWSVGAFLAVLLYSCAVWMAETVDFIKVPVRDWLPWNR